MEAQPRIIVADDDPSMQAFYGKILPELGYDLVGITATGTELVAQCRQLRPNLLITDIEMPDMDGLDAAEAVAKIANTPVVVVSAHDTGEVLRRAQLLHVMAYLVKPLARSQLKPAITIALARFRELEIVRQNAADLEQALQDRALVERAKTLLITKLFIDESRAMIRLQELACEYNRPLVDIARSIIDAERADVSTA